MYDTWKRKPGKRQIIARLATNPVTFYVNDDGMPEQVSRAWAEHRVCSGKAEYLDIADPERWLLA